MRKNTNEPHLGDCKSWAPLLLQNVKANATIAVDVRVENLCPKSNLHNYLVLVMDFVQEKVCQGRIRTTTHHRTQHSPNDPATLFYVLKSSSLPTSKI